MSMETNVLMPQLGESIAEGTIVRWNKQIGDFVDRDEPLFEVSTDKIDAEIPAPAGGIVTEVLARVGETVPVEAPADSPVPCPFPAGSGSFRIVVQIRERVPGVERSQRARGTHQPKDRCGLV